MSWICEESGFLHQLVPDRLIDEATQKALAAIEEEEMGWSFYSLLFVVIFFWIIWK